MEFLEAHRECGLVGSSIEFVDESYRRLFIYEAPAEHPAIMRALHIENCLIHSGVMIRSDVLRVVGGYREDLQASEDYELFLRIGRAARVATLSEVLTTCVRARRGISVARRKSQQLERLKLQLAHFDGLETASYYGVCRTVASMCCPYGLCERVKASLGNIGRA
jgi:hypothetical protein